MTFAQFWPIIIKVLWRMFLIGLGSLALGIVAILILAIACGTVRRLIKKYSAMRAGVLRGQEAIR